MPSNLELIRQRFLGKVATDTLSAAGNWLQLTIESAERGCITVSTFVKHDMTNPYGHIHGGMLALLIDESIGWAIISLDAESHYTSVNLSIDFLYAIKEGEKLFCTATIVRHGKKIINAEAIVKDAEGRLLAKATSNLVVTGMKVVDKDPAVGERV